MKNGVINVYKDAGMTSFQVVYQIRKLTGEKKTGHTGTLDPDATGVLPVCIGKATKLVDYLMGSDKQYQARMRFGIRTDTQDVSGTILEQMDDQEVHRILRNPETVMQAFEHFTGSIEQLPPMYSAVKVDGVKLVDAARKGREIERSSRLVTVHGYEDTVCSGFEDVNRRVTVDFKVNCSKGTYIRTLCEDIGKYLGVPACLEALERTRTGGMDLSTAHTLEEIRQAAEEDRLEDLIIPTDAFLTRYPALTVTDEAVRKLIYGNYLSENDMLQAPEEENAGMFRIYDRTGRFYAIYRFDRRDQQYKCERMFISEPLQN